MDKPVDLPVFDLLKVVKTRPLGLRQEHGA